MGVSRTMWLQGIRHDAAKMKAEAHREFRLHTMDITEKWNNGFKALKEENDRMQAEAKAWLANQLAEIDAMTKAQIAQGPPA